MWPSSVSDAVDTFHGFKDVKFESALESSDRDAAAIAAAVAVLPLPPLGTS
jgi:hypothetical protein